MFWCFWTPQSLRTFFEAMFRILSGYLFVLYVIYCLEHVSSNRCCMLGVLTFWLSWYETTKNECPMLRRSKRSDLFKHCPGTPPPPRSGGGTRRRWPRQHLSSCQTIYISLSLYIYIYIYTYIPIRLPIYLSTYLVSRAPQAASEISTALGVLEDIGARR